MGEWWWVELLLSSCLQVGTSSIFHPYLWLLRTFLRPLSVITQNFVHGSRPPIRGQTTSVSIVSLLLEIVRSPRFEMPIWGQNTSKTKTRIPSPPPPSTGQASTRISKASLETTYILPVGCQCIGTTSSSLNGTIDPSWFWCSTFWDFKATFN